MTGAAQRQRVFGAIASMLKINIINVAVLDERRRENES